MFYQESDPLGLPSAACQSMKHGHPGEAAATDVFYLFLFSLKCAMG